MAIPPGDFRVYYPRPPATIEQPQEVFSPLIVYGKAGRASGPPAAEIRLAGAEGAPPVAGELIHSVRGKDGLLRWAISFKRMRKTPAGQADMLVVTEGESKKEKIYYLRMIPEDVAAPVITYPGSTDTVCEDYFIAYGNHETMLLDPVGGLQVNGAAAGTFAVIRQTPRWVLEVTSVGVSAQTQGTLTVTVSAMASAPRTFTIDVCV